MDEQQLWMIYCFYKSSKYGRFLINSFTVIIRTIEMATIKSALRSRGVPRIFRRGFYIVMCKACAKILQPRPRINDHRFYQRRQQLLDFSTKIQGKNTR